MLEAEIGAQTLSDHSWTICDVRLGEIDRSSRRWSLNKALLQLDSVKGEIAKDIQTYFIENSSDEVPEVIVWDALKATIRGSLIAKSSRLKKTRQLTIQSITQNITRLETLHKQTGNTGIYQQLLAEREALKSIETARIQNNLMYLKQHSWAKLTKSSEALSMARQATTGAKVLQQLKDTEHIKGQKY